MVERFAARYRAVRFEIQDFAAADAPRLRRRDRQYRVPNLIQQADRLISVAPLKTDPETDVRLTMANYLSLGRGELAKVRNNRGDSGSFQLPSRRLR